MALAWLLPAAAHAACSGAPPAGFVCASPSGGAGPINPRALVSGDLPVVGLDKGGLASALADPGADRALFWDDSAGVIDWLTPGTGLAITSTTIAPTVSGLSGPASFGSGDKLWVFEAGGLTLIDYDELPGAGGGLTNVVEDLTPQLGGDLDTNAFNLVASSGTGLVTGTTATDTALLRAYDVDGTAYVTFGTLTAGNTPTFDLNAATTLGGASLLTTTAAAAAYQPIDSDLTTWAGLTPSANAQSLVTAANYAAMRTLLDLEAGTDFYSIAAADAAFQPLDAELTSLSGASANGVSLVTAANYAAMRTLLDLEAGTDFYSIAGAAAAFQPLDADLTTWAGLTPSANAQSLVTAADYAAMRTLLDLEAGTDFYSIGAADAAFQPLDAELTSLSGASANGVSLVTAANYAAMRTLLDLEAGTDFYSIAAADAAFQPIDSDLTALAALSTTAAGRSVLTIADPGADRVVAWDDTAGAMAAIALADLTDEATPAAGDYMLIYGAEGDLRRVDWGDLPGAAGGISNLHEDLTPQLGGDLDTNAFNLVASSGTGLVTGTTATDAALLRAYDVDGAAYTTFFTLTAGNTPTADLAAAVTIGGAQIVTGARTLTGGTGIAALGDLSADRTVTLDLTELSTATFGAGSFTALAFDAGATDPTFTFGSNSTTVSNSATFSLGTSAALTTGTIELGAATDTTLARVAAGRVSVESVELQKQPTSDGIVVRTAAGTAAARSVAVTSSTGLSVSNGDGVAGNPTLAGIDATTSAKGVSEFATAAEYRTGTDTARSLVVKEVWDSALNATLTDGANIAVDLAAGFNFGGSTTTKLSLGGNRTLSAPSNVKGGQTGVLWFGAATSTRTLTLDAAWVLMTGVETGPYSITTAQTLGLAYVTLGTTVYVTAILRQG